MSDSVHCEECRFFIYAEQNKSYSYVTPGCLHQNNEGPGDWKRRKTQKGFPMGINKNCDCGWFEKKAEGENE